MIAFLITLAMGLFVICSSLECAEKSKRRHARRIRYIRDHPNPL